MRRLFAIVLLVVTGLLAGCGPSTSPTARPSARQTTPNSSAMPTPTPAPDTRQVDITVAGVGAYNLVAVPVAIVHSQAVRTEAIGVVVHFTTTRRGVQPFSLDSEAVVVFPGQSLAIAANCTDACNGAPNGFPPADAVTATVTVTDWQPVDGTALTSDPATYVCRGGCSGHGYGDVTATIHGTGVLSSAPIDVFAVCMTSPTTIVGGGQRSVIWPQAGGTVTLDVPVILSAQPASCAVGATLASSTAGNAATSPGASASPTGAGAPSGL